MTHLPGAVATLAILAGIAASVPAQAADVSRPAAAPAERSAAQQTQPPVQGQPQRGGQGGAVPADPNAKVLARVRVPTTHANIHAGPGTGSEVLVLAPKETEMDMIGRRGEWIQVRLLPQLRKTGIVMRWYKNETAGWMHDSAVQFVTPETKP